MISVLLKKLSEWIARVDFAKNFFLYTAHNSISIDGFP